MFNQSIQGITHNQYDVAGLSLVTPSSAIADRIIHDQASEEIAIYTGPELEPIQVKVLGHLGAGIGDRVYEAQLKAIKAHPKYIFEEGEHSALVFGQSMRDESALYVLAVGEESLTWHRHPTCAHRIITVTTGSGGAVARFSLATDEEIAANPRALFEKMVIIELPADAQVSIRFNGLTYHQFGPRTPGHPAFVGNSVHKNERNEISEVHAESWKGTDRRSENDEGSIPLLTKCLSPETLQLLGTPGAYAGVTTVIL